MEQELSRELRSGGKAAAGYAEGNPAAAMRLARQDGQLQMLSTGSMPYEQTSRSCSQALRRRNGRRPRGGGFGARSGISA